MVKLADLGTAKVMQDIIVTDTYAGTEVYMSPEMFNREEYSFPTDIWYYGASFIILLKYTMLKKSFQNKVAWMRSI